MEQHGRGRLGDGSTEQHTGRWRGAGFDGGASGRAAGAALQHSRRSSGVLAFRGAATLARNIDVL